PVPVAGGALGALVRPQGFGGVGGVGQVVVFEAGLRVPFGGVAVEGGCVVAVGAAGGAGDLRRRLVHGAEVRDAAVSARAGGGALEHVGLLAEREPQLCGERFAVVFVHERGEGDADDPGEFGEGEGGGVGVVEPEGGCVGDDEVPAVGSGDGEPGALEPASE